MHNIVTAISFQHSHLLLLAAAAPSQVASSTRQFTAGGGGWPIFALESGAEVVCGDAETGVGGARKEGAAVSGTSSYEECSSKRE